MIQELLVYRGTDNHNDITEGRPHFFSSSSDFAENYGKVKEYSITIENPFDTCAEKDINLLLQQVGTLTDHYSDKEFECFQELQNSGLLYTDTWEIFETFLRQIELLGYDGMVIYEGGVRNYVTFKRSSSKIIKKN